ncbi:MAG: peptide-methionine (S)-S-oxide reductase MsrA [Candidatus Tectimicrobiota bacterium]
MRPGILLRLGFVFLLMATLAASATVLPAPPVETVPLDAGLETTVVAGGCFWGVQAVFAHVKGVTRAVAGYTGGSTRSPTYDTVSNGDTGHAEAVHLTFDPRTISYGQLLQIYFAVAHDPTERHGQGPDFGTQYRSALFTTNPAQQRLAEAYIAQLSAAHVFNAPIVTTVAPLTVFYAAEDYHQDYAFRHPSVPYIMWFDLPKIRHLKQQFAAWYRDTPALVRPGKIP